MRKIIGRASSLAARPAKNLHLLLPELLYHAPMRLLVSFIGLVLVLLTLWDVFSVMVVTRRATRQLQLSSLLISVFRRLYIGVGRFLQDRSQRENFLGILGPLLLFVRFALWAVVLMVAFGLLQWGAGERIASPDGAASFGTLLYYSGTTFFTV